MIKLFIGDWAKAKNVTMANLAQGIGITASSLSQINKGSYWPKFETVDKIATVLNIEPYQLFIDPSTFEGKKATGVCPHCGKPIDVCLVAPE